MNIISGLPLEERGVRPAFTVVIPTFNEGTLVQTLYERLHAVMDHVPGPYELIMVDDGSTDETFECLRTLHEKDPAVKIIRLARNFGHQTAISAGLTRALGDYVAVIDADLQDPPELFPTLLAKLNEGYDVVYGIRTARPEGWVKRTAYFLFYRLLRAIAQIDIPLDSGDFCLMRREVVLAINSLPERNRFLRGLRSWVGFRQVGVPYSRQERAGGTTKYSWGRLLRLSLDGLVSFSDIPLRLASYLGFGVSAGSFMGICVVLYLRLFTTLSIPGFASLAILILFLGGIQLLTIGILGEYLGRMFEEVKQRPLYITSALIGWPSEPETPTFDAPNTVSANATGP
jgi:dolichol-phosphate mannosyltransferase